MGPWPREQINSGSAMFLSRLPMSLTPFYRVGVMISKGRNPPPQLTVHISVMCVLKSNGAGPTGAIGWGPTGGQKAAYQSLEKAEHVYFGHFWGRQCLVGEKVSLSVFCLRFLSLHYKESRFVKGDAPRCWGQKALPHGGRVGLSKR